MRLAPRCAAAILLLPGLLLPAARGVTNTYSLSSPDGAVQVSISASNAISWSVTMDRQTVIEPSQLSMTLASGTVPGSNPRVSKVERRQIEQDLKPVVREKTAVIHDRCNELTLDCDGGYSIVFRAYDNGVAYRFETALDREITVQSEQAEFHFARAGAGLFSRRRKLLFA